MIIKKMKILFFLVGILCLLVTPISVTAANILVEGDGTNWGYDGARTIDTGGYGQSFAITARNITAISVRLNIVDTNDIDIYLDDDTYTQGSGAPSTPILTGVLTGFSVGSDQWLTFDFASQAIADGTYWIILVGDNVGQYWYWDLNNPYSDGRATLSSEWDFGFRVYADDAFPEITNLIGAFMLTGIIIVSSAILSKHRQ